MGVPEHMNKPAVAASMGIDLPRGDGPRKSTGHGAEIIRRAAYGKVTPESLSRFLEVYKECGHKAKAALAANLSYDAIRRAERSDPDFAAEVEQAHELFTARLCEAAYKAAVEGWKVPKYDAKGQLCGHEWKFSERILELLLKRHDPAFREKADIDVKHSGGVVVVQAPAMVPGSWDEYAAQRNAARKEVIDVSPKPLPDGGSSGKVEQP